MRRTRRGEDVVAAAVGRLEEIRHRFGPRARAEKLQLLGMLDKAPFSDSAPLLLRFHETLCFLRAYPDGPDVLRAAEAALGHIPGRVARLSLRGRRELDATGVAGTAVRSAFSLQAARWATARFPGLVDFDWADPETEPRVARLLPFLAPLTDEDAFVEAGVPARRWLAAGRPAASPSDLHWTVERLGDPPGAATGGAAVFDALELPVHWELGATWACRTLAHVAPRRVFFHRAPLRRWRGALARRLPGSRLPVRRATGPEAEHLLDLAQAAVLVRYREVHAFNFANPGDVLVADAGRGVAIVWFGVLPPHRLPLRAHYGYLLLKNGVPVGYGDASLLFEWVEIAFNIFETFRGGESAFAFVRLLALLYQQFGARAFHLSPYQLGQGNEEALESGAFWFYDKLGFRPKRPDLARLAAEERRRLTREPDYRSSRDTLARLSSGGTFWAVGDGVNTASRTFDVRRVVLSALAEVGPDATAQGRGRLAARLADRLGLRGRAWAPSEGVAFARLAPILAALPGLPAWPHGDRQALVQVIRAKGGAREADYLRLLRRHRRLRASLLALGRTAGEAPAQRIP
jgi:hypothetical protein